MRFERTTEHAHPGHIRPAAAPSRGPARRGPPTLPVASTIGTVLAHLVALRSSAVVGTDGSRPVGVFTAQDAMVLVAKALPGGTTLRDHTRTPFHAIGVDATAADARAAFARTRARHLVVTRKESYWGVLTPTDLARAPKSPWIADCVAPVQWTADWSQVVRHAAGRMARHRIGALPILGPGDHVEGLVTRDDLIRALLEIADDAVLDAPAAWVRLP